MKLSDDKRKFKEQRNKAMMKDWTSLMTRKEIAKKHNTSPQLVYLICRHIPRKAKIEEAPILTEGEQRIKDRLSRFYDKDVKQKFHDRDPNITNHTGSMIPDITVRPKLHGKNYSQSIWR